MNRRTTTGALGVALTTSMLLTACGDDGSSTAGATDGSDGGASGPLVVSGFSFGAEDFEQQVVEAFEEQSGIDVEFESGSNSDRFNQLQVQRNAPETDVILISDIFAETGEQDGLFEEVPTDQVPNLADAYDFAQDTGGFGVPYTYTLLGMLYSTDTFSSPPTLEDLWDPQYAGKIAVPDISATAGTPFLLATAQAYGSGPEDVETAFSELEELKPDVLQFYSSTTEVLSLIERGEVVMAPGLDLFAYDAVAAGQPIGWAPLDDGRFLSYNKAEVVSGTEHADEAYQFIDYLLSPEVQTADATAFSDKPVNTEATVPDVITQVSGGAASDPGGEGFTPVDLSFVVENRQDWIDTFTRRVSG